MAVHLDLIHLRRHALPAHFMAGADRPVEASAVSGRSLGASARPRLVATWRLDASGRPVCGWSFDTGDPAWTCG